MPLLVRFTLGFMLVFMALFLIALVLIQRGRGGGLAGAFGGAGGQSAFGTKAGDLFTRITVVVAAIWIVLCILATNVLGTRTSRISPALGGAATQADGLDMLPAEPETKPDAGAKTEPERKDAAQPAAAPAGEAEPGGEGGKAVEPAADDAADQPGPVAGETAPPVTEATPPASPAAK